ncbi:hypothetical protein JCM3774_003530 [Rhodotorula dairenensis]
MAAIGSTLWNQKLVYNFLLLNPITNLAGYQLSVPAHAPVNSATFRLLSALDGDGKAFGGGGGSFKGSGGGVGICIC